MIFNLLSRVDLKELTITIDAIKQQHLEFLVKINHYTLSAFPATLWTATTNSKIALDTSNIKYSSNTYSCLKLLKA